MNNKEKFYAELNGLYAYLYEWKELIENNKSNYSTEDYKFQLGVLQSLRGQLKFQGNMAWKEIEKAIISNNELESETEQQKYRRVANIIKLMNKTNKNYDDYCEISEQITNCKDKEKLDQLKREEGFFFDAFQANSYKFEETICTKEREHIKDIIGVLDGTHAFSFDPFTTDNNHHIVLKTDDELESERSVILLEKDSAFNRFDVARKEGIINLFNKLYDSYVEDYYIYIDLEHKALTRKK